MVSDSTLLIVDDNPLGRAALEELLHGQCGQIFQAASGAEALALAAELTPDVVLLDVMMPEMDGFEVCRRLRADPQLAEVPVVMVTALDDQASRVSGLEAGADDFVTKPFNRTELRARVKTITRLNRYRKLRDEHARFQWMAQTTADGYVLTDEQDRLLYANVQARRYLGLPEDLPAAAAGPFLSLAQKHYRCESEFAWHGWPALVAPDHARYLVQPETSTTAARWLQVAQLSQPGTASRLIHLWDVTDQLNTRRDTRTVQTLLSHKLRTPLTTLGLPVEILLRDSQRLSPSEVSQLAEIAQQSYLQLQREIDTVLTFADTRNAAGLEGRFPLASLPALVEALGAAVGLAPIRLVTVAGPAALQLELAEPMLTYLLRELLENARKFHPAHAPAVTLTTRQLSAAEVQLQLQDDGLTLAPYELAQVWTPFYQGDKDFTGQVVGLGLGLPTVASIVWQLGGRCRMFNRDDGPGVVVELTLPARAIPPAAAH